jgi:hypothetical protein
MRAGHIGVDIRFRACWLTQPPRMSPSLENCGSEYWRGALKVTPPSLRGASAGAVETLPSQASDDGNNSTASIASLNSASVPTTGVNGEPGPKDPALFPRCKWPSKNAWVLLLRSDLTDRSLGNRQG